MLKFKKSIFFLPLVVFAFAYLIYSVYDDEREQTIDQFNAYQLLLAKQAAGSIENLFDNYFHALNYLADIDDIVNLNEKGKKLLDSYFENSKNDIRAVTRVDKNGKIIYTFPYNQSAIGADISYQEHIQTILKTHKPVVSDVFTSVQNFQAIAFHVPVIKEDVFYGTIAILIPFDNISHDYIENIKIGKNGYAWVLSENGTEIYCPVPGHVGKKIYETSDNYESLMALTKKMLAGEKGVATYRYDKIAEKPVDKINKLAVYYPIHLGNTFWSICINSPEDEVLAAMTGFKKKLLLLIALFLVSGIIYAFFFLRAWLVLKEEKKRRLAEKALRNSEKRFRELAELLPQMVFETDNLGNLLYVNSKAYENFEYTKEDFKKGLNALQMLVESDRQRAKQNIDNLLNGKGHSPNEYTAISKNNRTFPVLIYANIIEKNNQVVGLRGIIVDISDRKKSETDLKKSEEQFRSYVDNAPDGIFVCDQNSILLDVNKALCFITGYETYELLQKPFTDFISEQEKINFQEMIFRLIRDKNVSNEFSFIKKDKTPGFWTVDVVKLSDIKYLGFVKDITEKKHLEDQFRQAQKMEAIGHLAGGIAHDFNNLLTIINGYSEMILKYKKQNNIIENVRQILKAGQRAENLTSQLLAYSRKQVLQPRVLNLNLLLSDLEKMLRRLIGEHIELRILYAENLKNIKADPGQLQQVILNIIINSRDAMPDGGLLQIQTENINVNGNQKGHLLQLQMGDYIKLSLSDTGFGMDKKTLSQIFDPFFTTKGEGKGTGLGLSTVYGIIKQSDGNIFVQSEPGKGATFSIYLKAVDEELPVDIESSDSTKLKNQSDTILVIEDDDAVRGFAINTLKHFGYQTIEAANGKEALLLLKNKTLTIDLLLTDIIMPGESGTDAAKKILELYPELPVLYMSGYNDETITRSGIFDKNTFFIQKPFSPNKLVKMINQILKKIRTT